MCSSSASILRIISLVQIVLTVFLASNHLLQVVTSESPTANHSYCSDSQSDGGLDPHQQPSICGTTVDCVREQSTATRTPNQVMTTNSDPSTYLLDSSVATLILDGELWEREPYTLMGHRKELRLQLELTKISLHELEMKSTTLR